MYDGHMSDRELVEACLSGNEEAYRIIMQRYSGKAMALALNMLRHRQDAEDVCQEVFVKAYHSLDKYDPRLDFKNWFYTVLYRRCLDQMRKRKRYTNFMVKFKNEPLPELEQGIPRPARSVQFNSNVLQDLSPKERMTLILWANEGYSGEEIASVLKCSPSTARVYLFKARKKLKAMLEKENVAMQNG
jgi:RNA polymerase sigma-70 factor (ECF subfamily)